MKKLEIEKIDGYNYYLKDSDNCKYNINIEFYDVFDKINIGDVIYINERLLKEKILNFGLLDSIYGRTIKDSNDADIAILKISTKTIYLKRIYG